MQLDEKRLQELRKLLRPYLAKRNDRAVATVVIDLSLYFVAVSLAVLLEPIWVKIIFAVAAGTMISTLFVLGHDAAHGGLTSKRWLNQTLARLVFLPSLHNYTLWLIQHNQLHHRSPNVQGLNSWSPHSVAEYRKMSVARRVVEKIYRGGGFGFYYLIERWWKDKFIPSRRTKPELRRAAWWDFVLLAVWLCLFLVLITRLADRADASMANGVLWGFVVPFLVWNYDMGLTVFLQHTHPAVPWFRSERESGSHGQEELTIHVQYPRWYGILSHDIMEHPAHHINPMIPFYNLHRAQLTLNQALGNEVVVERIGFQYVRSVMRRCKLYDYDRQEWLDFSGRTTGQAQPSVLMAPEA
jgi:acyl-lipid omega-6 desaturase (Delta-12 desaturase)